MLNKPLEGLAVDDKGMVTGVTSEKEVRDLMCARLSVLVGGCGRCVYGRVQCGRFGTQCCNCPLCRLLAPSASLPRQTTSRTK